MLKNLRVAAFLVVVGLGVTGSAQELEVGRDGSVKMGSGDSQMNVGANGDVSLRAPGSRIDTHASTSRTSGGSTSVRQGRITLAGTGQEQTVTCDKGAEVIIEGASNSFLLQGECARVSVAGTSNQVHVESVGRVSVEGVDNVVLWERGLGTARKPKVSTSGVNNKVARAP